MHDDLSFDPRDPYFPIDGGGGIRWAVQVFTTRNGYGLDGVDRGTEPGVWTFRYAQLGQQRRFDAGQTTVRIERDDNGWVFHIEVAHSEPVKSVKLILRGLPADDLAQGWWSPTTPRGTTQQPPLQWSYPGPSWATRWAAAGAVSLSIRSRVVSGAVLHVASPPYGEGTEVEVVHAVPASEWSSRVSVPPIRLAIGTDAAAAERDLDAHVRATRECFGIPSWPDRPDVPDWARDLDLVVTLHGQHWTGHVFHTFADMTRLLTELADDVDPSRVLVYVPGWEGRYYFEYPNYAPGEDLGGEVGFAALVESAHALGYRVMPMFGANGASVLRYPDWQDAAIRNPSNRYPVLLNAPDWDGDRHPEGDQVFLNPGEPRFRAHLVEAVSRTVERYGVDAAFFDTASFWFDDPRNPLYDGYRALTAELRTRHPELLLVSEGWWDAMTALFPMSQQWLGIERDIRAPGLVTEVARTTAHLADGTPGSGSTGVHEQGFRTYAPSARISGHLPVIAYAGGDGSAQREAARRLQQSDTP
ncbi:hypothetical protein GCM10017576_14930 [Microbacterium barkeri]|uniref:Uncharacterized protein n=1 Tax=Microbacterium barkeri TaxID=33917 RepID=A0A9W6H3B3_9MICO|nr:hypothetical protein [Microbacterium barkeri]MDI6943361.1 hypothetical protein [Microbacterium barkeri]MDR6878251.1 hypothetical protein [Microbacterium barkeri]GLJ61364.1 hypothetical protein GCM10017576_14930 [Microbacterium barkeri]